MRKTPYSIVQLQLKRRNTGLIRQAAVVWIAGGLALAVFVAVRLVG